MVFFLYMLSYFCLNFREFSERIVDFALAADDERFAGKLDRIDAALPGAQFYFRHVEESFR